jgi:hypothetical protein
MISKSADKTSRAGPVTVTVTEQQLLALLDEQAEALPESLTDQLAQRRAAAFGQAMADTDTRRTSTSATWYSRPLLPVGVTACLILASVIWLIQAGKGAPAGTHSSGHDTAALAQVEAQVEAQQQLDDMMALAALDEDEWDILQQLEFAYWLSELPNANPPVLDKAG